MKRVGALAAVVVVLSAVAFASASSATPAREAAAALTAPVRGAATVNICASLDRAAAVAAAEPGDLLAPPQDVTAVSGIAMGRLYRVLYATTGDGGSVVASCGLIAVPASGVVSGVVAWAHGTVGLMQSCQPSGDPAAFVGAMPGGIGVPVKGMAQQGGPLYAMLGAGYAVVATDYPSAVSPGDSLQRYVVGVAEAVAVIDSARVLTNNERAFGAAAIGAAARLPLVVWGHSQGGGSALWAGQLATSYLASHNDRTLDIAGVVGMAPATQFTTSPGQPAAWIGKHLGDRDMYNMRPGLGAPFPIGVALFSYVTASWSQVANATQGDFPFGPTNGLNAADVLSDAGTVTAPRIAAACLGGKGLLTIVSASAKYLVPSRNRFFGAPFDGRRTELGWRGGIDSTCADPSTFSQGVRDWCAWLQFHMPGPNGVNPYPKVPVNSAGAKVPVLVTQGRDDRIMWCVDGSGPVSAGNCLAAQFYDSMQPQYCPRAGSLAVRYFSDVDHLTVPGATAYSAGSGTYRGSALDTFVSGAMGGTLRPGCSEQRSPDPLPD